MHARREQRHRREKELFEEHRLGQILNETYNAKLSS